MASPLRWLPKDHPHAPAGASGRVVQLRVDSQCLLGNLLGDPHVRELPVYLPPGYDDEPQRRYPVAFYLTGYMGVGASKLSWKAWGRDFGRRLDRMIGAGALGPINVAFPDCFTLLGGSQYINSSVVGSYDDHLNTELVPLVDRSFRTFANRRRISSSATTVSFPLRDSSASTSRLRAGAGSPSGPCAVT